VAPTSEPTLSGRGGREILRQPPAGKPSDLPEPIEISLVAGWRLHWEPDPREPPRYPSGKWRFDAPAGEYPVTYCNLDPYAAFAEVYGDTRSIAPNQSQRAMSTIWSERPLLVIDLDNSETLAKLDLDLKISTCTDYKRTMAWSKALHHWYPKIDGLQYLGRHATTRLNLCLFLDRCKDALGFETEGTLGKLRSRVLRAADAYNLAPRLIEDRDPGTGL
jgi:RES domain